MFYPNDRQLEETEFKGFFFPVLEIGQRKGRYAI